MFVKKVGDHYEFESPTADGAFIVKLLFYQAQGEESVATMARSTAAVLEAQRVEPGTIRRVIGEDRWNNFLRMKDQGAWAMFIDPHESGVATKTMTP